MRLVELDLNGMKDEKEVHGYLKEQMDFPDYYGENLDALYDVLTDLSENICVCMVRCADKDALLYDFGARLERVMEDAAQTVQFTEGGKMYAIFAGVEPLESGSMW